MAHEESPASSFMIFKTSIYSGSAIEIAFGLLSRLEGTGRALAATPAMLMVGSAIGTLLGGTLVKFFGYPAIGVAACIIALVAVGLFSQARMRENTVLEAVV